MNKTKIAPCVWGIVPAAGKGERFKDETPKQYCRVQGKTILEHTLTGLLENTAIQQIVVAISKEDHYFSALPVFDESRITTVMGGDSRMGSVVNALAWIETVAEPEDWVLIHDAVRPILDPRDLENLLIAMEEESDGVILGSPVKDTLKFVEPSSDCISHTVSRGALWHSSTPQLFRLSVLLRALKRVEEIGLIATDEAQMVEQLGAQVKIVPLSYPNPKLTYPEDLLYFDYLLSSKKETIS
jgi:2-C-methyl-D-erythritol 4-phosphate cytidylyltransferase